MNNTILALAFAYIAIALLLYKIVLLERRIKNMDKEHRKMIADAGMALTNTLKVAFDNLKRNNAEHNKINSKLTEYNSRIHRLEQHTNRSSRENKDVVFSSEENLKQKIKI